MAEFFRRRRAHAEVASIDAWLRLGYDEEAIWTGLRPGPSVAAVAARLGSLPGDFLDDRVSLAQLAGDVLEGVDEVTALVLAEARGLPAARQGAAVALWLWASEHVVEPFAPPLDTGHAARAIAALALRLAPVVPPEQWLVDAERRDEATRLFLLWSGLLPAGEDPPTARARWERLDSLARDAAIRAALEEQQHRLEVQRRLEEKRAAEAATRYTRE